MAHMADNNLTRIMPSSSTTSTIARSGGEILMKMPRFFPPRENDETLTNESPNNLKLSGALSPSKRSSRSRGASPLPRRLGQQHHRSSPSSLSSSNNNNNNRRSPLSPANRGQIATTSASSPTTSHTKSPRRSSPSSTTIMQPQWSSPARRRSTLSASSNHSKICGSRSNSISPSSSSSHQPARRRISLSSLAKDTSFLQKLPQDNDNINEKENEKENAAVTVPAVVSTSEEEAEDDASTNDLIRMLDSALQSMDPTITSTAVSSCTSSSNSSASQQSSGSNNKDQDDDEDNLLKEILSDRDDSNAADTETNTTPGYNDASAAVPPAPSSNASECEPTTEPELQESEKDHPQPHTRMNQSSADHEDEQSQKTSQSASSTNPSSAPNSNNKPTKRVSLVLPTTSTKDDDDLPITDICTTPRSALMFHQSLSEHSCLYSDARRMVEEDVSECSGGEPGGASLSSFFTAVESSGCFDQESIASLRALQGSDYFGYILEKDKLIMELKKSFALTKEEEEEEDSEEDIDEDNDKKEFDDQSPCSSQGAASTGSEQCHVPNRATTETMGPEVIVLSSYDSEEDRKLTEELDRCLSASNGLDSPSSSKISTKSSEEDSERLLPNQSSSYEELSASIIPHKEEGGSGRNNAMVRYGTKEEGASDSDECFPCPTIHFPRDSGLLMHSTTSSDLPSSHSLSLVLDVFSIYYMYSLLQADKQQHNPLPRLLLMGESLPQTEEVQSDCGAMVVYENKPTPEKLHIPVVVTVIDPELQYGLALFQLLVIKQNILFYEKKSDPKQQKEHLERMVKTLQFCLTLRDESGTCSIRMEMAQALDSLGCLHKDDFQDYPQSFLYYTQALETKSHIYGANAKNLELAGSMETLGLLMRDKLGCVTDSIRCFTQALKMKQHVYDQQPTYLPVNNRPSNCARQHAEMAQTYHSLGLAYDMSADYENAYSNYEKALSSRKEQQQQYQRKMGHTANQQRRKEQVLIKARKQLVATLFNLGCVAEKLKRLEEGRSYLEEALQMQYELHAPLKGEASRTSANGLIGTLFRLASIYERCKELEGAYKYYKIALDIHYQLQRGQTVKTNHPLLIALLHGAANASNLLGHYEDSLFAYESLMDTLRKENVKDRRLLVPTLHHLGLLNDVLGNIAQASKYYRLALGLMDTQESLQESPAAVNIRMNVLCLAEPLSDDPKPRLPVQGNSNNVAIYDSVMMYYASSMNNIYKRQDYVHKDAAMAITYRNAALVSATHFRNYADAHNQYEQYLETIWYHCRDDDPSLSPSTKASNSPLLSSRSLVVCQALYGLGLVERKLRQYGAARHYQREGLGLLMKAKKQHLCGKCAPPTVHNAKRMANLQTAMGREFQLLNSGCKWISWLMD